MPREIVTVECYSGYTYAQEPRAFVWRGQRLAVTEVERAWRLPEGPCFRVQAEDGRRYDLAYDEKADVWHLAIIRNSNAEDQR